MVDIKKTGLTLGSEIWTFGEPPFGSIERDGVAGAAATPLPPYEFIDVRLLERGLCVDFELSPLSPPAQESGSWLGEIFRAH